MAAVARAGATADDIQRHSPYDGDNDLDFLYVPKVRAELEADGFDGFQGWDVLTNFEIPVIVVWNPAQIHLLGEGESLPQD